MHRVGHSSNIEGPRPSWPWPGSAAHLAASQLTLGLPERPEAAPERFRSLHLPNSPVRIGDGGESLQAQVNAQHSLATMAGVLHLLNLHPYAGVPAPAVLPYPALPYGLARPAETLPHPHPASAAQRHVAAVYLHSPNAPSRRRCLSGSGAGCFSPGSGAAGSVPGNTALWRPPRRSSIIDHPALDGVLAQLPEPGVRFKLRSVQLRPELAGLEPEAWEPPTLLPPPGYEGDYVVAGDPRRHGMAVESRRLALAGLQFYDLAD